MARSPLCAAHSGCSSHMDEDHIDYAIRGVANEILGNFRPQPVRNTDRTMLAQIAKRLRWCNDNNRALLMFRRTIENIGRIQRQFGHGPDIILASRPVAMMLFKVIQRVLALPPARSAATPMVRANSAFLPPAVSAGCTTGAWKSHTDLARVTDPAWP